MALPIPALLVPVLGWVFREIVVKFMVFTALYVLIAFLVPYAVGYLAPFIGGGSLSNAFAFLPAGAWFFIDFFRLDYGIPLLISAFVARFLIRRLPVIG